MPRSWPAGEHLALFFFLLCFRPRQILIESRTGNHFRIRTDAPRALNTNRWLARIISANDKQNNCSRENGTTKHCGRKDHLNSQTTRKHIILWLQDLGLFTGRVGRSAKWPKWTQCKRQRVARHAIFPAAWPTLPLSYRPVRGEAALPHEIFIGC